MKKLMSILFSIIFLSTVAAQDDVTVYRINDIDLDKEYESYAFLEDKSSQSMDQGKQGTSYRDSQMDGDRDVEVGVDVDTDQQRTQSGQYQDDQSTAGNYDTQTQQDQTAYEENRTQRERDMDQQGTQTGQSQDYTRQDDARVGTTDDQRRKDEQRMQGNQGMSGQVNGWATLNPMENTIIKEAITYEFDVQGLERTQSDPDMYVQYHIYDDAHSDDEAYINTNNGYDYTYTKKQDLMANIEDGTVVLSIVDAEEGKSVWEGFAYNAYEKDASLRDKQQGLRQAVDALVTQFLADNEDRTGAGTISR